MRRALPGLFGKPPALRELIQCDSLHRHRSEAHLDERLRAVCTDHEKFIFVNRWRRVDSGVNISLPVGDVLLPSCEITAAHLAILFSREDGQSINRMDGQVDRTSHAQ